MSAAGHSRARNVRFRVLIVSDAATLILSDAQQAMHITSHGDRRHPHARTLPATKRKSSLPAATAQAAR